VTLCQCNVADAPALMAAKRDRWESLDYNTRQAGATRTWNNFIHRADILPAIRIDVF
jgi:hypothetical protein